MSIHDVFDDLCPQARATGLQADGPSAEQAVANIRNREHFRKAYLEPLVREGWLERTIPDKPRSRLQRYRTTEAGLRALTERTT